EAPKHSPPLSRAAPSLQPGSGLFRPSRRLARSADPVIGTHRETAVSAGQGDTMLRTLAIGAALAVLPAAAFAQSPAAPVADSGDTGWILASTALVLLMTLPGLGLFYGGLVRAKNLLSVLLQIGAVASIASLLW